MSLSVVPVLGFWCSGDSAQTFGVQNFKAFVCEGVGPRAQICSAFARHEEGDCCSLKL